jgi:hypothetical protein
MSQLVLAYPFTPSPDGSFDKVESGTDLYKGHQIMAFVRTRANERPVMSDFGTQDPAFDDFDAEAFAEKFRAFYPSTIKLRDIEIVDSAGAVAEINVSFE